jgi:hypothetical protein
MENVDSCASNAAINCTVVCLAVKPVGEPDAVVPHVRFVGRLSWRGIADGDARESSLTPSPGEERDACVDCAIFIVQAYYHAMTKRKSIWRQVGGWLEIPPDGAGAHFIEGIGLDLLERRQPATSGNAWARKVWAM